LPTDLPKRTVTRIPQFAPPWLNDGYWALTALSIPALLIVLSSILPSPLVLPAFGIITVSWGVLLALRSYLRPAGSLASRQRAETLAGLFLLFGFGASMMTNVGEALSALAELERAHAAGQLRSE
jgi:hypothetical protein